MMKTIQIETAANGYIVTETEPRNSPMMRSGEPYVFETFAALCEWLGSNLNQPKPNDGPSGT